MSTTPARLPEPPIEVPVSPQDLPAALHDAISIGGVRYDLFRRTTNGLEASGALIYRGRRILIYPRRYLAWLESRPRDGR